jgi:ABC-type thiamin/hydroxymethylpyrimidine transport system permease subunit
MYKKLKKYDISLILVIGIIIFCVWLFSFVMSYTFGGKIHVLLFVAALLIGIWAVVYFKARRIRRK